MTQKKITGKECLVLALHGDVAYCVTTLQMCQKASAVVLRSSYGAAAASSHMWRLAKAPSSIGRAFGNKLTIALNNGMPTMLKKPTYVKTKVNKGCVRPSRYIQTSVNTVDQTRQVQKILTALWGNTCRHACASCKV